jgi:hypothetical protein
VKIRTWEAIARRHLRYRDLLTARLAESCEARSGVCTDIGELRYALKLAERSERHEDRASRHLERALILFPVPAGEFAMRTTSRAVRKRAAHSGPRAAADQSPV